jgi:phospholipid/cholesterol/gamma-HCH transport system substrate-binding protein
MMRLKALLLILAGSLMLTGCGFDVYKLPLPGGASVGDNPITITVEFQDVLDLVPKSTVKVNDVSVGQVTDVELDGQSARVTLQVRRDTKLPDNAIAEIRQTSLLGEKFVSLSAPPEGASDNLLQSGDTIPLDRSGRNPEVEEVLGALSLLLNGGGVAQLKTIAHELNLALEGREDSARSVLDQIRILMTQLDENKGKIVDAIDSLNTLAVSIQKQQGSIDSALEELPSALTSLDKQRNDLVKMLQALNRLGDVGVRVIQASKVATIDTFRQLEPVLTELAASGDDFAKAFNVFLTYPFVDEVVGRDPQVARNLHMGDYTNLSIQLDISVDGDTGGPTTLPTNLPTIIDPTVIVDNVLKCIQSGDITSKACQKVLSNAESLAQLREECKKKKNEKKDVCKELNQIPGLPVPSSSGGLPTTLPTLPRPGYGPTAGWSTTHGPTMRQLTKVYDPALVSLLVPGMVVR